MSASTNLHTAWARLFVRALADAGVRDFVVSPGSRSTPLALAASAEPSLRCHVHVDERVAGFFALGQARATGRPSVLLCTSGTAGAHWLPAVIEAELSGIPMVLVTADRPWEAYDCASPQTIDQVDLFGRHVRHRAELGAPDPAPSALRAVGRIASQCVHRARWPLPGPVHVNARFRKPLEPVNVAGPEAWEALVASLLARGPTRVIEPVSEPSAEAVGEVLARVVAAGRGWVVCGPSSLLDDASNERLRDAALGLCARTGFVLMAEATSALRFGGAREGVVALPSFDALLRVPAFREAARPDVVIELGQPPTSGAYGAWVDENADVPRVVVAPQGWPDPSGSATTLVLADPGAYACELAEALVDHNVADATRQWARSLAEAQDLAWEAVVRCRDEGALSEGAIPARLVEALPAGAVLCVGNSLPARDVDAFTRHTEAPLRVLHQRGASGIDGIVAGAAGTRSVVERARPVAVYLGDVSMLHDLGGLNAARHAVGALVIVVVQNDGGRIFEQLPLGRQAAPGGDLSERFTRFFTTPQSVTFEHAAAMFGVGYRRVDAATALDDALREALSAEGAVLIEAVVDPAQGKALRAAAHDAVRAALARWGA